jgi:hypothetical protein
MNGLARASGLILSLGAAALLSGCANPDQVLFVTSTSVGLGFDATTATGHLGFDRQEAYVGPDYPKEKGALPPVAAALQSDLDWFSPKIAQFYATGDVALIATGKIKAYNNVDTSSLPVNDPACALNQGCSWSTADDRRLSIVATSTHVGLVVKTQDTALSALDFGYGRQEASLLPLGTMTAVAGGVTTHKDYFPSVFASINVNAEEIAAGKGNQGQGGGQPKTLTGLPLTQFFATGAAADALASRETVKNQFGKMSDDSAAAAAAAHEKSLAAGLGMTDEEFKTLKTKGVQQEKTAAQRLTQVMTALVGAGRNESDALGEADKAKIRPAVDKVLKLPGLSSAEADEARGLEKSADVKALRRTLSDDTSLMNKLYDAITAP